MASSCASRSYKKAGVSASSPKGTFVKMDVLRCCGARFSTPCPQTFGSYYVQSLWSPRYKRTNVLTPTKFELLIFLLSKCLLLGRKQDDKITCRDWYPPTKFHPKKRYQISGNVLGLQWGLRPLRRSCVPMTRDRQSSGSWTTCGPRENFAGPQKNVEYTHLSR
ncbi:hypothetical protein TNCV_4090071 [Trichonephila clavipes]|uniref:Uncharacterized protein n=1 Tax=Trichonephila clavipes TaxID=2585209 RepID=A0A8X6VI58_TRICX|nr:hypothetical protein TNCV_4090071 [Trichonephila clavipes]